MNENACICPSSNVVSARALEKVGLKRVMSTAASIATLTWHDLEPKVLDEQFLVPMANLILCFKLNFAAFCGYIWVKNQLYTFKIYQLARSAITIINKQNKYLNSIYEIYLQPCHDHYFSLTYFQNNMTTHNDLDRRLFTLKRFQYCRFQNTFQLACLPSLLSTCRSRPEFRPDFMDSPNPAFGRILL